MHFSLRQKVLFRHCDPAGIVFYPRYFEMLNDAVEAMFDELLHWPFEEIHAAGAVPTAALDTEFKAPSRHGDMLSFEITIVGIGTSSMRLTTLASAAGELRFAADQTLVLVGPAGRPVPWPHDFRGRVGQIMKETA